MTISGVAPIGTTTSSSVEAQVARLRRQETELTRQLSALATSDDDAETKQTKQQLLTAQIQAIELQIARLQNQQSEQTANQTANQTADQDASSTSALSAAVRRLEGTGTQVDVQA